MVIYSYFDLVINIEIINKLFYIIYLFFVKSSFFLYFIIVMFCQFNVYLYLLVYSFFCSSLSLNYLLNIEFTSIQYFHILLKLFKVYVYIFMLYKFLYNLSIYKLDSSQNVLLFFLLVYLYLLTGSFWSWLEPSWTSWWFGEDIEELLIFIVFLNFIAFLHYLNTNYFINYLILYSFFLLFLSYIGNLVIFTSRHKTTSYYSIINFNLCLLLFFFSFKLIRLNYYWYLFNFRERYNTFLISRFSKNLNKISHYYVYVFYVFFFLTYVFYELPIFFKFFTNYISFYFFIPNITTNDAIYVIILSFFTLITKVKLFNFYLIFVLDWDLFLHSILFLLGKLVWSFHFFFIYVYLINTNFYFMPVKNITFFESILDILKKKLTLSVNTVWLFCDNIINIDIMSPIFEKDLLYFFLVFSLVLLLSAKLI
jgi:hypothetical protein